MAYTKQQTQTKKELLAQGFDNVKMNQYGQWEVKINKLFPTSDAAFNELPQMEELIRNVCPDLYRVGSGTIISPMGTKVKGLYYTFYESKSQLK